MNDERVMLYDTKQEIDVSYIKSLMRNKEIEHEKFIKYTSTYDTFQDFTAFDLKTTYVGGKNQYEINQDFETDIIQLTGIKFKVDINEAKAIEVFNIYIRPKENLNARVVKNTGITNDMLNNAADIKSALIMFLKFIGDSVLVTYNVGFNITYLMNQLYICGFKKLKNKFVNLDSLAEKKIRYYDSERDKSIKLKNYSLDKLGMLFDVPTLSGSEIEKNCMLCAYIYCRIIKAYSKYGKYCYIDYSE